MRVITWNCRRASAHHPLWEYFAELDPDVALLQEVCGLPSSLHDAYESRNAVPTTRRGNPQIFQNVLLTRGTFDAELQLFSEHGWVRDELLRFAPNLLAHRVAVAGVTQINIVDAYAPAWPIARERLKNVDVGDVKLRQNRDVWVSDILWSALQTCSTADGEWIVGGDFNSCETFDQWKGGPRGNREWLDRMAALGFAECLRHSQGKLTPTFRGPGKEIANCQIDHLFVTSGLAARLRSCFVGSAERVYGQGLSDHLPIIADFD